MGEKIETIDEEEDQEEWGMEGEDLKVLYTMIGSVTDDTSALTFLVNYSFYIIFNHFQSDYFLVFYLFMCVFYFPSSLHYDSEDRNTIHI
jgi:hypothetical protein